MINEFALVFVGMIVGALLYFVLGWVTLERTVQELTLEAQTMRQENGELREIVQDLAQLLQSAREATQHDGPSRGGTLAASFDESIYSVAVERELASTMHTQPLVDSAYFRAH